MRRPSRALVLGSAAALVAVVVAVGVLLARDSEPGAEPVAAAEATQVTGAAGS